jgi:hypothetical protein
MKKCWLLSITAHTPKDNKKTVCSKAFKKHGKQQSSKISSMKFSTIFKQEIMKFLDFP